MTDKPFSLYNLH